MEKNFKSGDLVVLEFSSRLGLIKEVVNNETVSVWFHCGGTAARCPKCELTKIEPYELEGVEFSNQYAVRSLLERKARLDNNDGPTDDLVDDPTDIRESIRNSVPRY